MRFIVLGYFLVVGIAASAWATTPPDYETLSAAMLTAIMQELPSDGFKAQLAEAQLEDLVAQLDSDTKRKTFWINVYNSYILLTLRDNPELYQRRSAFFSEERMHIAGLHLSFDDIEHGILRHSRIKLSPGYVGKAWVADYEKQLRVEEIDWHIHFGLNCGAKSCPPVEVYRASTLDAQLERNAKAYLKNHTRYHADKDKVELTMLMSWFRGDFGGVEGAVGIVKKYGIVPEEADPSVDFATYNWTLDLTNFVGEAPQKSSSPSPSF